MCQNNNKAYYELKWQPCGTESLNNNNMARNKLKWQQYDTLGL